MEFVAAWTRDVRGCAYGPYNCRDSALQHCRRHHRREPVGVRVLVKAEQG
jgi:hypothetical protein